MARLRSLPLRPGTMFCRGTLGLLKRFDRLVSAALVFAVLSAGCVTAPTKGVQMSGGSVPRSITEEKKSSIRTVGVRCQFTAVFTWDAFRKDRAKELFLATVIGAGVGVTFGFTTWGYTVFLPNYFRGFVPQSHEAPSLWPYIWIPGLSGAALAVVIGSAIYLSHPVPRKRVEEIQAAAHESANYPFGERMSEYIVAAGVGETGRRFVPLGPAEAAQSPVEELDAVLEVETLNISLHDAGDGIVQLRVTADTKVTEGGTGAILARRSLRGDPYLLCGASSLRQGRKKATIRSRARKLTFTFKPWPRA